MTIKFRKICIFHSQVFFSPPVPPRGLPRRFSCSPPLAHHHQPCLSSSTPHHVPIVNYSTHSMPMSTRMLDARRVHHTPGCSLPPRPSHPSMGASRPSLSLLPLLTPSQGQNRLNKLTSFDHDLSPTSIRIATRRAVTHAVNPQAKGQGQGQ